MYTVTEHFDENIVVKFKKLHPDAVLPVRAKPGDAGFDLTSVDDGIRTLDGTQETFSLGLGMELPPGYVGLLFPRSSIVKTPYDLANSVGVIDSGYRGEVKAVFNRFKSSDKSPYKKGDRIVQLVVLKLPQVTTEWVEELSTTERGEGGYGSTGR